MVEAVVTYDYEATQDDELTLKEGQTITNITVMEEGWWEGEINGRRGLFPDNFVELIKKDKRGSVEAKALSPSTDAVNGDSQDVPRRGNSEKLKKLRAKVVYSYSPQNEDEISLAVDDVIEVTGQPEEGWWEGVLKGRKGMFPSNFVTVIEGDEGAGDKADGATTRGEPPPLPEEPPRPKPPKVKGVGFGNIFAGGEVKLRKTGGTPQADPSKKEPSGSSGQSELAQKRLSLKKPEAIPTPKPTSNAEAKPREAKKEIKPEVKKEEKKDVRAGEDEEFEEIVKERAKVSYPYEAQHSDELELKEGDIVTVLDKEAGDSGWWFGEIDGRKGVFPDNFVTMLPPEKEKVKKKGPAPMPTKPASGPKPAETKPATPKPAATKPSLPQDSPALPKPQPSQPATNQEAATNAEHKEPPSRKPPHPIAAPKPVLPVPPKKPAVKSKVPPPKPSAPPPEREEVPPPVVLRRPPAPAEDTKEKTEGGFEDLKSEGGQKLTHITLSRPKNANRRPPSVFGGQGVNLSEARLKAQQHEENADSPDGPVPKTTNVVTSPTSPTNANQAPWVRELKARSLKRPSPLAKEPQPPVENGTAVPPPRPKSSPIGPSPAATSQTQAAPATNSPATVPTPSPAASRPTSQSSDTAGQVSTAQVEELKKEIKSLQEQMASMKSEFKKEVVNLMTELDEEKKHRMAMQVELDRIKKLVLEKQ